MPAIFRKCLAALLLCPLFAQAQPAASPAAARGARTIDRPAPAAPERLKVPDRVLRDGCPTCSTIIGSHGTTGAAPVDSSAGSSEVSATGASAFRPLRLCGNKQNYFNTVTGQCLSKGEVGLSGPAAAMVPSAAPLPVVCQKKLFFNTLTEKCLSRDEVARE